MCVPVEHVAPLRKVFYVSTKAYGVVELVHNSGLAKGYLLLNFAGFGRYKTVLAWHVAVH